MKSPHHSHSAPRLLEFTQNQAVGVKKILPNTFGVLRLPANISIAGGACLSAPSLPFVPACSNNAVNFGFQLDQFLMRFVLEMKGCCPSFSPPTWLSFPLPPLLTTSTKKFCMPFLRLPSVRKTLSITVPWDAHEIFELSTSPKRILTSLICLARGGNKRFISKIIVREHYQCRSQLVISQRQIANQM